MRGQSAFRRCHVCGTLCESDASVKKCSDCGKTFAPFYYFNDQFTPIALDQGLRSPELPGEWRPVQGLTAYWQTD